MADESHAEFVKAAIGLGGNVGDVPATMRAALTRLAAIEAVQIVAVSSLYRTPPWGKTDQPWFFNACAVVATRLQPEALLHSCLQIELALKRDRQTGERWGPRPIDLDILLFENAKLTSDRLTVPHPRMAERAFVLVPLAEIAPEWMLDGQTIAERAERITGDGIEIADGPGWMR